MALGFRCEWDSGQHKLEMSGSKGKPAQPLLVEADVQVQQQVADAENVSAARSAPHAPGHFGVEGARRSQLDEALSCISTVLAQMTDSSALQQVQRLASWLKTFNGTRSKRRGGDAFVTCSVSASHYPGSEESRQKAGWWQGASTDRGGDVEPKSPKVRKRKGDAELLQLGLKCKRHTVKQNVEARLTRVGLALPECQAEDVSQWRQTVLEQLAGTEDLTALAEHRALLMNRWKTLQSFVQDAPFSPGTHASPNTVKTKVEFSSETSSMSDAIKNFRRKAANASARLEEVKMEEGGFSGRSN